MTCTTHVLSLASLNLIMEKIEGNESFNGLTEHQGSCQSLMSVPSLTLHSMVQESRSNFCQFVATEYDQEPSSQLGKQSSACKSKLGLKIPPEGVLIRKQVIYCHLASRPLFKATKDLVPRPPLKLCFIYLQATK